MPAENKTPNIGLNQWQGNEYPKRQDFNEDNLAIDMKIGELEEAVQNVEVPVTSVNDKTGDVVLTAADVGAETPSGAQAKANAAANAALGSANAYTDQEITTTKELISAAIPSGLISMWSGLISAIPNGWVLCDGQNGTPNLTDRFIMGASTEETIGDTGGQNEVILTEAQMPSHTHTGSTNSTGAHSHRLGWSGSNGSYAAQAGYRPDANESATSTAGAHTHIITINNAGSGQAHENRPAYYTLAFIMKV